MAAAPITRSRSSRYVSLSDPGELDTAAAGLPTLEDVTYRFGDHEDLQNAQIQRLMRREDFFLRVLIPRQPTLKTIAMEPLSLFTFSRAAFLICIFTYMPTEEQLRESEDRETSAAASRANASDEPEGRDGRPQRGRVIHDGVVRT